MDTWGTVPKSQVDPETIEEAIARLIQAHLDDENAHIETGQSLEVHKASEIIDHLATSVVRDKLEFDRFTLDIDFQTKDAWSVIGPVGLVSINELSMDTDTAIGAYSQAYINTGDALQSQTDWSLSPNWQVRVYFSDVSACVAHWGMFDEDYISGAGFELVGSHLYAVWFDNNEDKQTYDILTMTDSLGYVCRFAYDYATSTLTFYVNGALVHTVVVVPYLSVAYYCLLYNENVALYGSFFWLTNYHFDAEYV